jgi:hypothetical protein
MRPCALTGPRTRSPCWQILNEDDMVETLMREVERITNEVMPPAARGKRIAQLEAEIEAWQRQAVALNADDLLPDLPAHVVLGVRVTSGEARYG